MLIFIIVGLTLRSGLLIQTLFNALQLENVIAVKNIFLINVSILFILYHVFLLNTCECLIYHQLQ